MRRALTAGFIIALFMLTEGHALKIGAWGGVARIAGDEISDSDVGYLYGVGLSHTVVEGVDYELGFQYARVTANSVETYVKKSVELSAVWYPNWSPVLPFAKGHLGFHDWRIGADGAIFTNPETGEEMKSRSLGLGGSVGGRWQLDPRLAADLSLSARFIFSQDGFKFGSADHNEVYFETSVGLWYRLF